jgi:hypothetical protein
VRQTERKIDNKAQGIELYLFLKGGSLEKARSQLAIVSLSTN